jgi:hypothetical protein
MRYLWPLAKIYPATQAGKIGFTNKNRMEKGE